MDYTSRLVIVAFLGGWIGYGVSLFFGDPVYWILIVMAFSIASDSAIRMFHSGGRRRRSIRIKSPAGLNPPPQDMNVKEKDPHF